jgi:hypothetical protein
MFYQLRHIPDYANFEKEQLPIIKQKTGANSIKTLNDSAFRKFYEETTAEQKRNLKNEILINGLFLIFLVVVGALLIRF